MTKNRGANCLTASSSSLNPFILMMFPPSRFFVFFSLFCVVLTAPGSPFDDGRDGPYRIWLGEDYEIHRSGEIGERIRWVIAASGNAVRHAFAGDELTYTHPLNETGKEYFVYLEQWTGLYYGRVSNFVAYRVGNDSQKPMVTSDSSAVAVVGVPFNYQIRATGNPDRFSATDLPLGLELNEQGQIAGTPTEIGSYLVTLTAAQGADFGKSTLALTVVSGQNDGGDTDLYTIVLDSDYRATWNYRGVFPGLTMVSKRNGSTFFRRNALGTTQDWHYNIQAGSTYSFHLEFGGTRVSNIAEYTPEAPNDLPNITSPPMAGGTLGRAFSGYQITAEKNPSHFAAGGLPMGLTVDDSGWISGTPQESGTFSVRLAAANHIGFGMAEMLLVISNTGEHEDLFTVKASADGTVQRSEGSLSDLMWIVHENGIEILRQRATKQTSFRYYRHNFAQEYTVHLAAWLDGHYQRVSNIVGSTGSFRFATLEPLLLRVGESMQPLTIGMTGVAASITAVNLPSGLSLDDGVLSGMPSSMGVFDIELRASSEGGEMTTAILPVEVLPAPQNDLVSDRYALAIAENLQVIRTPGEDKKLTWVVVHNGREMVTQRAGKERSFVSSRNFLAGEFAVYLAARVNGEMQRVSNIVGYTLPASERTEVFLTPRRIDLWNGREITLHLLVSGKPDSFRATDLPEGLSLSEEGLLAGTPLTDGRHEVLVEAIYKDQTAAMPLVLNILHEDDSQAFDRYYHVSVEDCFRIVRTPGKHTDLTWVVKRDGARMISKPATHFEFTYPRNFEAGVYSVRLEAFVAGEYRVVSNSAQYTVDEDSLRQEFLAHALGGVPGNPTSFIAPKLEFDTLPNGNSALFLTYSVNLTDPLVRAQLEGSTDLTNWTLIEPIREVISGDGAFEIRRETLPVDNEKSGFFQVRLERMLP